MPQGSKVGPILFNAFLNDFFYTTEKASAHYFETIHKFVHSLKLESETAVKWVSEIKMIEVIVISKNKSDYIPSGFSIGNDNVTIQQSVRLLRIDLHNQLDFNLRIRKIDKSASNQTSN